MIGPADPAVQLEICARLCYRWMGRRSPVVTDGRFERAGCPKLSDADARSECQEGARSMEGALETFS